MDTNQNKSRSNSDREVTFAPCGHPTHRGHEVTNLGMVECRDCVAAVRRLRMHVEQQRGRDAFPFVATDHAWTRREMESSYRAIVLFVLMGLAALAALVVLR